MNLIGISPYDRKTYDREMENVLKKRLLGFENKNRFASKQMSISGAGGQGTPVKFANGLIQYTNDHRMNILLNHLASATDELS